jgi:putative transcriptional regulator
MDEVSGNLLVAEPFLKDSNFRRSVIYMCSHEEEGSFGFIINRRLKIDIAQITAFNYAGPDIPVYEDGPVQKDTLHMVHRVPDLLQGGLLISNGMIHGGSIEDALELIEKKLIQPFDVKFFIGYSGWGAGQLNKEINEDHSWLISPGWPDIVFHTDETAIWPDAIRHLGKEYEPWIHFPIDPQLN